MTAGGKMSQCTLCGHPLDRSAPRKKTCSDAATETDLLSVEAMGGDGLALPARLNSNGTLVGLASNSKTKFISSTNMVCRAVMTFLGDFADFRGK